MKCKENLANPLESNAAFDYKGSNELPKHDTGIDKQRQTDRLTARVSGHEHSSFDTYSTQFSIVILTLRVIETRFP